MVRGYLPKVTGFSEAQTRSNGTDSCSPFDWKMLFRFCNKSLHQPMRSTPCGQRRLNRFVASAHWCGSGPFSTRIISTADRAISPVGIISATMGRRRAMFSAESTIVITIGRSL